MYDPVTRQKGAEEKEVKLEKGKERERERKQRALFD
jgi:hypothetical protein